MKNIIKKIGKIFLGICLGFILIGMLQMVGLALGVAYLTYKAYEEYKINKFSGKFKAECAGIAVLTVLLIAAFNGSTDTTQVAQDDTTTQVEQTVEEPEEEEVVEEPEEEEEEVSEVEETEPEEEIVEEEITEEPEEEVVEEPVEEETETTSFEYEQALKAAEDYLDYTSFSKQGLYEQLTSEYGSGFSSDAAQYAVDNVNADWYAEAVETAEAYLDYTSFSKQGLYEQLTSEYGSGFTDEEAQYAVDTVYK